MNRMPILMQYPNLMSIDWPSLPERCDEIFLILCHIVYDLKHGT